MKAAIILATGFEEIEAIAPLDILRRGGVDASLVGLDAREVVGAHGVSIKTDSTLKSYDFSHILIDPPRAGASASVLDFIKNYANIIYVSCSQETLARDLLILSKTHRVDKLALFDQFVHTNHIESIVILSAKI